jgi:hypothetical protein
MSKAFDFCIPTRGTKVPPAPDWIHEIKYDGYRLRLERDGDRVRLITRNGYDWTKRYPWIVESALKNRMKHFIIDGEAVILGTDGRSDFDALHSGKHNEEVQSVRLRHARRRRRRHAAASALDAQGQFGAAPGPSHRGHLYRSIRTRRDRPRLVSGGLQHGTRRPGIEAPRPAISRRPIAALGEGEKSQLGGNDAGQGYRLVKVSDRRKSNCGEIRAAGVRGLVVYLSDYHCAIRWRSEIAAN